MRSNTYKLKSKSNRKNKHKRNSRKVKSQKKLRLSKKYSKKLLNSRYRRKRNHSYKKNKRYSMRGGMSNLNESSNFNETVPFVPPGGPYVPGASDNGLGKGYYYSLSPDLHAPNNDILPSNQINTSSGMSMSGGGRRYRRNKRNTKNNKYHRHPRYKHLRGGGIIPQDLLDLGRLAGEKVTSYIYGLNGQPMQPSQNPNPTYQPALERESKPIYTPLDLQTAMNRSDKYVASL
jgi:hypothetical protein